MAGNYGNVTSQLVTEVSPANTIQDTLEVTAQAVPSGAVFHVRFPPAINDSESIDVILTEWANQYNALAAIPNVGGVSTYQDIDANNQLVDVTQVTVTSASGKSSNVLTYPDFSVVTDAIRASVAATSAFLTSLEGL